MADKEADKRAELERKIRMKVACEEKAHYIVHRLLDNPISHQYLFEAAQFITPDHYQDVVEERSIVNQCGFPLCQNNLTSVPKQKYQISLKNKKVYDITERKKFCSNQCFKASQHFLKQISSTPVWAREEEESPVTFTVLSPDNEGSAGETVVGSAVLYGEIQNVLQEIESIDKTFKKCPSAESNKISSNKIENKNKLIEVESERRCVAESVASLTTVSDGKTSHPNAGHVKSEKDFISKSNCESSGQKSTNTKNNLLISESDSNSEMFDEKATALCKKEENFDNDDNKTDKSSHDDNKTDKCGAVMEKRISEKNDEENTPDDNLASVNRDTSKDYLLKLLQKKKKNLTNFIQIEDMDKTVSKHVVQDSKRTEKVSKTENNELSEQICENGTQAKQLADSIYQSADVQEQTSDSPDLKQSVVLILCKTVEQWISPDTLKFLNKSTQNRQKELTFEEKYDALCRRIESGELDIEDDLELGDAAKSAGASKPVPDFDMLSKETDEFQIKVKGFLEGKTVSRKKANEEPDRDPLLPVIDSHNQLSIRQKIVSDKLDKVIHDVLKPLKLSFQEVTSDMKSLISSFYFTNTNILFKPQEWMIVAIILVTMLGRCNASVKNALRNETARKHFNKIMRSLRFSLEELESVVVDITEIKV